MLMFPTFVTAQDFLGRTRSYILHNVELGGKRQDTTIDGNRVVSIFYARTGLEQSYVLDINNVCIKYIVRFDPKEYEGVLGFYRQQFGDPHDHGDCLEWHNYFYIPAKFYFLYPDRMEVMYRVKK